MEYKKQTLKAGSLTGQFEEVNNFKIVKPSWKKTFGGEFFLTADDSLETKNASITNVLDVQKVNGVENVLSYSGVNINLSIGGTVVYTGVKGVSEKMLVMRGGYNKVKDTTVTEVGNFDPTLDANDVYSFGYIRLKCASNPAVGEYVTFTSNIKNLQGVSTRVHYVQGGYIYIRGTNLYGTLPDVGDTITVHSLIGDVAVIGEKTKLTAVYDDGSSVVLYQCNTGDEIIDIEKFNQGLFVLTKLYLFYSRALVNCNMNIYPLDFFDNMVGGDRIIKFGKLLVMFGDDNQIISPVNGTAGSVGYIAVDLNYDHKLYSKYSAISSKGSLYVLQEDKEFVKVSIISTSNTEYDVVVNTVLNTVQGMLDDISGDVYMSRDQKYITIINDKGDGTSKAYAYNTLYDNWGTKTYSKSVRSLGLYPYGATEFTYGSSIVPQSISFHLGGDNMDHMKICFFVKFTLEVEDNIIPDFTFQIDKYIGGLKTTRILDLKDFPINTYIDQGVTSMGDTGFGMSDLNTRRIIKLGKIITPRITINETADLFVFTLTNKQNKITYGGSVIGYANMMPEVTAYNYNIKSSTRPTGIIT